MSGVYFVTYQVITWKKSWFWNRAPRVVVLETRNATVEIRSPKDLPLMSSCLYDFTRELLETVRYGELARFYRESGRKNSHNFDVYDNKIEVVILFFREIDNLSSSN